MKMNHRFSSRVVSYLAKLMMIRGNIHHFWCEMILIRNFWRKWNLDLVRAISAQLGKLLEVEPKGVHDDSIAVLEPLKHQETSTPSGAVKNIDVWCTRGRGSWWLLDRRFPFPPLQGLLRNWSTDHVGSRSAWQVQKVQDSWPLLPLRTQVANLVRGIHIPIQAHWASMLQCVEQRKKRDKLAHM